MTQLVQGQKYFYAPTSEVLEFSRIGGTGKAIIHPPGEPDMQSSMAVDPEHLTPVDTAACPECGGMRPVGHELCLTCQSQKNLDP